MPPKSETWKRRFSLAKFISLGLDLPIDRPTKRGGTLGKFTAVYASVRDDFENFRRVQFFTAEGVTAMVTAVLIIGTAVLLKSGCTLVPPKTQLSHSSGWDDSVLG